MRHAQPFGDKRLQPLTPFLGGLPGKKIVDLSVFRRSDQLVFARRFVGVAGHGIPLSMFSFTLYRHLPEQTPP